MSLKDSGQYYHEVLKRIPPRDLPAFKDESELAQPTTPGTAAARHLEKYGEGVYLLIFEVDELQRATAHLTEREVAITRRAQIAPGMAADFSSVWIHPRAMKGVFMQLLEVLVADHPWPPAGAVWRRGRQ